MNIADLFVRVRGDTSDVSSKLRGVGNDLAGVEKASKSGHVSLGRLGNQFENLSARIIGVNPVVSKMSAVLSDFAIGSTLTVGVLAGVAAVATVFDKLTESSRKAMEVGDKLAKTYQEEARIMSLGIGGKFKADIEDMTKAMQENAKWLTLLGRLQSMGGPFSTAAGLFTGGLSTRREGLAAGIKQADIDRLMAEIEEQDDMMTARNKRELDSLNEQIQKEKDITAEKARQQSLAIQYSELMKRTYGTLGTIGHDFSGPAMDPLQRMLEAERAGREMTSRTLAGLGIPEFSMPNVGINDGLTKEQIVTRDKLIGNDDKNSQMLKDAIWGSALAGANTIVSALNLGGGGKGSNLGGALGSTAGFAAGFLVGGPIGGAIGSTIGNIAGSLLGGIFDHNKKAVESNTRALDANTAVLSQLLNAPSGYKVASARYDATQVRAFRQAVRQFDSRGGAPLFGTA